jgi:hypothetical protein
MEEDCKFYPFIDGSEVYLDRVQSQEELAKLLSFCMKEADKINLEEFTQISEKLSCEMFLCVPRYNCLFL